MNGGVKIADNDFEKKPRNQYYLPMPDYAYKELPRVFKGYSAKKDLTTLDDFHLVSPSQNVLYSDDGTIQIRKGFTLYGAANTALTPVRSHFDWDTSTGVERNLRFYDDELEYYFSAAWRRLKDGNSTTALMRFATFWNNDEVQDELLFVDETANIHTWSGAVTTFASATSNTITKQGGTTWKQDRFWTTGGVPGSRQVIIGGTTYTYTGGETTTALTGVTPDPTAGGHTAGDVVVQAVRSVAGTSFTRTSGAYTSKLTTTTPLYLIAVLNNQCYVADEKARNAWVSQQNFFYRFATYDPASAARKPGDHVELFLDDVPRALVPFEDRNSNNSTMFISAGKDYWYQLTYASSGDDSTKEAFAVKQLPSASLQGARTQETIQRIGNEILYISNEPALVSLSRVAEGGAETTTYRNLSDLIKTDFDGYDFANSQLKYHRTLLHIALPAEGKSLIYNIKYGFWEAPQIIPARRFAIIGGAIYFHSANVPESYKLFDGTDDNDNPLAAYAYFNYQNFGDRFAYKQFTDFAVEGYISANTTVTLVLKYDFGGFTSIKNYPIKGTGSAGVKIIQTTADGSLGKHPIGSQPIGSVTDSIGDLAKFLMVQKINPTNFRELQVGFESNDIDFSWRVLCFGPKITKADAQLK